MTTVQDLLETARAFCQLAERETNRDAGKLEKAAQYAAIAQAHAATAQALLLADLTTISGFDSGETFRPALRTYSYP